jgi:hypothetical protein
MQKQSIQLKNFIRYLKLGTVKFQLPRWEIARIRYKVSFDERRNEEYLEAVQNDI